ncbi:MAG TPA: hypothetical protein VED59_03770, partial [Acidimicrobiales bacterium]|nr:hypothetical protein [Acidimicrobiales bacterium]
QRMTGQSPWAAALLHSTNLADAKAAVRSRPRPAGAAGGKPRATVVTASAARALSHLAEQSSSRSTRQAAPPAEPSSDDILPSQARRFFHFQWR